MELLDEKSLIYPKSRAIKRGLYGVINENQLKYRGACYAVYTDLREEKFFD